MEIITTNSRKGQRAYINFGGFKVPVILGDKVIEYGLIKYYCKGTDKVLGNGLVKERDLTFVGVL